jgi:hypothetical protein
MDSILMNFQKFSRNFPLKNQRKSNKNIRKNASFKQKTTKNTAFLSFSSIFKLHFLAIFTHNGKARGKERLHLAL